LLEKRTILRTAYVVVASDKGLTGAFNSNVFRAVDRFLAGPVSHFGGPTSVNVGNLVSNWKLSFQEACFIAVGEKARLYLARRGATIGAAFTKFSDFTRLAEIEPLETYLIEGYLAKKWDRVVVFYTNFKSALTQEVITREILPVDETTIEQTAKDIIPESGRFAEMLEEKGLSFFDTDSQDPPIEYMIEPSAEAVLNALLPHLIRMQIYHIILEANASEHSARRLAMKNASDNASDLADDLSQDYNKSRQAVITRELTEITAGAEAIQK